MSEQHVGECERCKRREVLFEFAPGRGRQPVLRFCEVCQLGQIEQMRLRLGPAANWVLNQGIMSMEELFAMSDLELLELRGMGIVAVKRVRRSQAILQPGPDNAC